MKRKTLHVLSLTAISVLSGISVIPVNAEITDKLQIMQEYDEVEEEAEQTYHYLYKADGTEQNFIQVKTSFSDGFSPEELTVGDFEDYDGKVKLQITDINGNSEISVEENEKLDLSEYENIKEIVLQPEREVSNASMDGLSIQGKVGNQVPEISTECSVLDSEDGREYTEISKQTLNTKVNESKPVLSKPEISVNKSAIEYLGTGEITVKNISSTKQGSYEMILNVPKGISIDDIQFPTFDHASCTVYADEILVQEGQINQCISTIKVIVEAEKEFSQTGDMKIAIRSIMDTKEKEEVEITGNIHVDDVCEELFSNRFNLVCMYQIGTPAISSSSSTVEGHDDFYVTVSGFQGSGSASEYLLRVHIPENVTVATIDVPEFCDADGNALERTIMINGSYPSIVNKKINVYGKVSDFTIRVDCSEKPFTQTKPVTIRCTNNAEESGNVIFDTEYHVLYGSGINKTDKISSEPIFLKKVTEPTPEPEPEPVPDPEPEQPEQPDVPDKPEKPEDPDTSDKPETVIKPIPKPIEDPRSDEIVVTPPFIVSENTPDNGSTPVVSIVEELRKTPDQSIQITEIQDEFPSELASADATSKVITPPPAEKIEKSSPEKVKEKVEEKVKENRGVQVFLIIGGIIAAGIAVIMSVFIHDKRKKRTDHKEKE